MESIDTDLDDHIRKSPVWRVREALLTSVPGVGTATARTLLAEIPELGSLDRRQVAALAGLAPWTRQSGKRKGSSFTGGGGSKWRTFLFTATLVGRRYDPNNHKTLRYRLTETAKPKFIGTICKLLQSLTP
jgi:transposase